MAEIEESKKKMDIREEDPEVTVLRILSMLRLLKYKPPVDISQQFREGLLEGHKLVRSAKSSRRSVFSESGIIG